MGDESLIKVIFYFLRGGVRNSGGLDFEVEGGRRKSKRSRNEVVI